VPKSLDPLARGRKMPLPDPRPSAKIAKLFPQTDPLKDSKNTPAAATTQPASAKPVEADATATVPLPEARPAIKPDHERRRHRRREGRGG
jgi:membrane-bound lytic murein transglycosylase A